MFTATMVSRRHGERIDRACHQPLACAVFARDQAFASDGATREIISNTGRIRGDSAKIVALPRNI